MPIIIAHHGDEYAWSHAGAYPTGTMPKHALIHSFRVQFIADIRGARVRDLEEKRINKEMANIRKKFKGALSDSTQHFRITTWKNIHSDGNLDGYQKKKLAVSCISRWDELVLNEEFLQICVQNSLYVYPGLQSGRMAYGG